MLKTLVTRKYVWITCAVIVVLALLIAFNSEYLSYLVGKLFPPKDDEIDLYADNFVFEGVLNEMAYQLPQTEFFYMEKDNVVYYFFQENEESSEAPRSLSYISGDSMTPYMICTDETCMHNTYEFKRQCELCHVDSEHFISDLGYLYIVSYDGRYYDDARKETIYQLLGLNSDDDGNRLENAIIEYHIAAGTYRKLVEYDGRNALRLVAYENTNNYLYYMEGDRLMRYEVYNSQFTELRNDNYYTSNNFFILNKRIYRLEDGGLYSYNLDFEEDSRFMVVNPLDFEMYAATDFQYDPYTDYIYFRNHEYVHREEGGIYDKTSLCKVRATGSQRAVITLDVVGEMESVDSYRLTLDYIYLKKSEIQLLYAEDGNYYGYDTVKDDNLYRADYLYPELELALTMPEDRRLDGYYYVFGNKLYGEGYKQRYDQRTMKLMWKPAQPVVVDLTTGEWTDITPVNWGLYDSPQMVSGVDSYEEFLENDLAQKEEASAETLPEGEWPDGVEITDGYMDPDAPPLPY